MGKLLSDQGYRRAMNRKEILRTARNSKATGMGSKKYR